MNKVVPYLDKKVRQSNDFVESPYAQEFTTFELKILEVAASECKQADEVLVDCKNNKEFRFTTKDLAKLLNTSVSSLSHEAERLSKSIIKKYIHSRRVLQNGDIEFETIAIIPYTKYENGLFEFELNYKLLPYFISVNGNFTEYNLKCLMNLKSAYAIKLYKLLFQYKNIGKRKFEIEELKSQFGILDDKYKLYSDFKRRILELSVVQINHFTELDVSYNEIKLGKRVTEIEFIFFVKRELKSIANEISIVNVEQPDPLSVDKTNVSFIDTIINNIPKKISSVTKKRLVDFYILKGKLFVECSINYALRNAKTNFDKYLQETLENGWADVDIQAEFIKISNKNEEIQEKQIEKSRKKLEEQQEQVNRQLIENEYYKLNSILQNKYENHANTILENYGKKLIEICGDSIKDNLKFYIYALSTHRNYNKRLELYLLNMCGIKLAIS